MILCTVALVGACHQDSGTPPPPAPTPHVRVPVVKKGPTAAELTVGMVEAARQGKSQLDVQLKFELPRRPILGQPLEVDLAVMPQIDAAAEIQVAGGDGLTLAAGANHFDLGTVEPGQVYRQNLSLTPNAEGVLLLSLTVLLKHDETVESRAFSIPLIVER